MNWGVRMTIRHIAAISIISALLALVPVSLAAGEIMIMDTLESAEWYLNGGPTPSPGSASLAVLKDSLIFGCVDPSILCRLEEKDKPLWTIDTVGLFGGLTILDLMQSGEFAEWEDSTKRMRVPILKAIAAETKPGKYRLLYVLAGNLGEYKYNPTFLVMTDGNRVLCTDCQMSGSGAFHDERYWVWDSVKCVPRDLKLYRPFHDALDKLLPEGHGIWRGSGPNIRTLFYEKWTWRDGDGNCCPSGGKVRIQLGIKDAKPYVKWGNFDYSDLEERIEYAVGKSGDSSYVKQPPRYVDSSFFDTLESQDSGTTQLPCEWAVGEVLAKYAKELLPDSVYIQVLHPAYWDERSLTYRTPSWKRGDPVGLKRGGTVEVKFKLQDEQLQPISISYTPPDLLPKQE